MPGDAALGQTHALAWRSSPMMGRSHVQVHGGISMRGSQIATPAIPAGSKHALLEWYVER